MLIAGSTVLAYDVPRIEDVGLPTKFRFKVGPASQPIAGSMPVNRLRGCPNANSSLGLLYTYRKHVAFAQCPRVVVSTAAFHARVQGSVPGLGGLKETKKCFFPIHV